MMINLTDMKTVRSILGRHGFHFSKKLGQNFLIDPSVCPRIAEEGNAAAGYGVLEIGPGIGTLTQQLALRAEKVTSVELDQRLLPILEETVGEFENLHILHGDILQFDVPQLLEQEFAGLHVAVCANLPYYITTPILMHLQESGANIDSITVMVQKEVAEKLQAPVGTPQLRCDHRRSELLWNSRDAVYCAAGQLPAAAECGFCCHSHRCAETLCRPDTRSPALFLHAETRFFPAAENAGECTVRNDAL